MAVCCITIQLTAMSRVLVNIVYRKMGISAGNLENA